MCLVCLSGAPSHLCSLSGHQLNAMPPNAGPTPDFRIKPDIVAPGTVTSAKVGYGSNPDCDLWTMEVRWAQCHPAPHCCVAQCCDAARLLLCLRPREPHAVCLQGTSMATPVTAASVALLRQYFMDGFYPTGESDACAPVTAQQLLPHPAAVR